MMTAMTWWMTQWMTRLMNTHSCHLWERTSNLTLQIALSSYLNDIQSVSLYYKLTWNGWLTTLNRHFEWFYDKSKHRRSITMRYQESNHLKRVSQTWSHTDVLYSLIQELVNWRTEISISYFLIISNNVSCIKGCTWASHSSRVVLIPAIKGWSQMP